MLNGYSVQSRRTALDAKLSEQLFKVGFVDQNFRRWPAIRWGMNAALIERLKQPHFGDGVLLAARERATVLRGPSVQSGLHDENLEGERRTPVGGDYISEFATGTASPLRAIALEKIILIDVAVRSRVALDAANSIGARHGRIIGGMTAEVNAGNCAEGQCQSETAPSSCGSESERCGV